MRQRNSRWPEYLPELLQAYNRTAHSATGLVTSYLMFGHHLRLPVDLCLCVVDPQPRYDVAGLISEHHKKPTFAYDLANKTMAWAARHENQYYDQRGCGCEIGPGRCRENCTAGGTQNPR